MIFRQMGAGEQLEETLQIPLYHVDQKQTTFVKEALPGE
jgi:hypothetical protein